MEKSEERLSALEGRLLRVAQMTDALNAKLEVQGSLIACLLATHDDPSAVLLEWRAIVSEATAAISLENIANPIGRELAQEAHVNAVAFWEDILQGIVQRHGE